MRRFLVAAAALALAATAPPRAAGEERPPPRRPHILFILADDLGWGDVGYHGSEIRTPHLDRLAGEGVRLDQLYAQPLCSPTRAALLTGRYPMRQGLQVGVVRPWADYGLPLSERTLPQALKEAGYSTAICGKWHLGHSKREYLPTRRGFDRQYGNYNGAIDYFTHLRDGGHDWRRDDRTVREEGYATDLIAAEASRIIEAHDPAKPLFLYLPFTAVHAPLQAPERLLATYRHIADRRRRLRAAMTTCMDEAIGRVVASIEKRGLRENTLIIFASDNGGPPAQGASNGELRGRKGTLYEGGIRVPAFATWPGVLKAGQVVRQPLHVVDWYPTLLRLAGAAPAKGPPVDGKDIWLTLTEGKPVPREEILHNVSPEGGALRAGDWKLVVTKGKKETVELFHIARDPFEKEDLAEKRPEEVKRLRARLEAYAAEAAPPLATAGRNSKAARTPEVWGPPD